MEIDFFNTLGVSFTIIGLMIALYQIAELQTRQEIIKEATLEEKQRTFKYTALERYLTIKTKTESLQNRINIEASKGGKMKCPIYLQ